MREFINKDIGFISDELLLSSCVQNPVAAIRTLLGCSKDIYDFFCSHGIHPDDYQYLLIKDLLIMVKDPGTKALMITIIFEQEEKGIQDLANLISIIRSQLNTYKDEIIKTVDSLLPDTVRNLANLCEETTEGLTQVFTLIRYANQVFTNYLSELSLLGKSLEPVKEINPDKIDLTKPVAGE